MDVRNTININRLKNNCLVANLSVNCQKVIRNLLVKERRMI